MGHTNGARRAHRPLRTQPPGSCGLMPGARSVAPCFSEASRSDLASSWRSRTPAPTLCWRATAGVCWHRRWRAAHARSTACTIKSYCCCHVACAEWRWCHSTWASTGAPYAAGPPPSPRASAPLSKRYGTSRRNDMSKARRGRCSRWQASAQPARSHGATAAASAVAPRATARPWADRSGATATRRFSSPA